MRKVLVFQHVAYKILGTLDPTLKEHGLRMRYVNFERNPEEHPSVEKYNGLIILGGHMGVYEADKYTHIKVEMKLIEEALKKNIPILGICLGSQLLAQVLGAQVRKHAEKEIGWHDVDLTLEGMNDPLFSHFNKTQKLFQLHGDTFDVPSSAVHLARSELCPSQAFRYGDKVYGLQFHLEVDSPMIHRWLDNPINQEDIKASKGKYSIEQIRCETDQYIDQSKNLSQKTFSKFIELFELPKRLIQLGARHDKIPKY
ncbi:MAG: type 1 glutamine amidotransferase [Bacteriovorax sp.]|jgi:GMP synthase (glutamine-hydrolysing)|nr:type 1 glutamine amidotransferase [Bacteriovorax sp.]